jgi:hypothetical protein
MLSTCEQLAAGLGAVGKRKNRDDATREGGDGVGNARLRLWVGERFLGAFLFYFIGGRPC